MNRNFIWLSKNASFLVIFLMIGLGGCQTDDAELPVTEDITVSSSPENGQIIEGQYIVVMKDGSVDLGSLRSSADYFARTQHVRDLLGGMLQNHKIAPDRMEQVYTNVLKGFSAKLTTEMLQKLQADDRVAFVEPDRIVTLAPPSGKGSNKGGNNEAQEVPYGIDRVGGSVNYSGSGVAYVIDTGIDLTHPDLNVDEKKGFNAFTTGKDAGSLNDGNGHGTHVAGTIAAINNSIGVVGVAAGAIVVPIKVLDSRGSGSYSGVIAGVDFVTTNGNSGDVANLSLGGPVSDALDKAVIEASKKGIKMVLAAGNSSDDANMYSPARVTGTNIYTISAMDSNDQWASFSNYSNPPIDYCAPGVSIKSTWKGGGYNTISGTSMAAPHAAGVLLLGSPGSDGFVKNDPDEDPDLIIKRK